MAQKKKKPECLGGYWSPERAAIARMVQRYLLIGEHKRGLNSEGEIYSQERIGRENNVSGAYISLISHGLELGAKIPTEAEFMAAEAAGISIPIDPNPPVKIIRLTGIPLEVPIKPEPPVVKQEPPKEKPAEFPANPPAEPLAKKEEISKLQMQAGVNQFLENIETGKARPIVEDKKNGDKKAEEIKPVLPEKLLPENQKPPEAKTIEAKAEVKEEAEIKPAKAEDKKMIVGGGLFESVHKVKLTLGTLVWFFYNMNVYGFEGTLDDFLNWCVSDCAKARGLSLEVVENPLELIGAGMQHQMQEGDGDGTRK